jgi:hypothetical protein
MLVHLPPNQIPVDLVYSWAELKETPAAADFRGDVPDQDSTRRFGQRWGDRSRGGGDSRAERDYSDRVQRAAKSDAFGVYGDRVVGAGAVSVG